MAAGPATDQPDSQLGETADQFRARFVSQLKEDNFVLYFQPIESTASPGQEGNFREVLVRYREEEAGLLPLLDRWVVARLLRWGRGLQASGARMPHCSVNLSIDTVVRDHAFGEYVVKGLEKTGISAASLTFEIMTTDALAHGAAVARLIPPLKAAGVSFALSWFAGEASALELAQALGFSYIKLDGSLAANIATDTQQQARLAALVQRCRKMGVRTVCMLVEDAKTLTHLRAVQVDYVQGFGIAKPRPLEP